MLLKHSASYLVARGLPGLITLVAIAVYTRLLPPDEYGRYVLVLAAVGLLNVASFQWLRLAVLRFLPTHIDDARSLLSTVLAAFSGLAILTGGAGIAIAWIWPAYRDAIMLGVPLLWALAWFELNLEIARSRLQLLRYGIMSGTKAVIALAVGVWAVLWGLGAHGPLVGVLAGTLVASLLSGSSQWRNTAPRVSKPILREILRYGLPLTATFALAFIVSTSDRFLIAWILGEGPAGVYAAAYDLTQQPLLLIMMVVNLAAYPLVVRALEQHGIEAARGQLRQNATLLMAVALPATLGLAVLSPNVAQIVGEGFREETAALLPWVAAAILVSGLRAYHFDLAFQLGKYTMGQVWVVGTAALLNVLLNLWWIPVFGIMGAAYATLGAYVAALGLSVHLGRRAFDVPVPYGDAAKVVSAAILMAVAIVVSLEYYRGHQPLAAHTVMGIVIFVGLIGAFNVGGYRSTLFRRFVIWQGR